MKLWLKLLLMAALTVWVGVLSMPDNKLHVVFCDVGQGDATLIIKGSNQLLIDGGPNNSVLNCLARHIPFYDRTIEAVVLTHNNFDHSKGLTYVAERYNVLHFEPVLKSGNSIRLGQIKYAVEWPSDKVLGANTISSDNELGIVGKLSYGSFDVLMTADVSTRNYDPETGIEVMKVPHHGSKTGLMADWIKTSNPKLAVISVGKGNKFGHPAPEVIKLLSDAGIKFLRTDEDGEVEIVSDGVKWWVK